MPSDFSSRFHPVIIHRDAIVTAHLAWVTQHHPKNPFWDFMDGMKLSPTWSASIFSFQAFFIILVSFSPSYFFFSWDSFFLIMFFWAPPLTPIFFWEPPTSPSNLPTYHPSSYQPTYLPHDTHLLLHSPTLLELENKGELQ
jgi:hypothetical protein